MSRRGAPIWIDPPRSSAAAPAPSAATAVAGAVGSKRLAATASDSPAQHKRVVLEILDDPPAAMAAERLKCRSCGAEFATGPLLAKHACLLRDGGGSGGGGGGSGGGSGRPAVIDLLSDDDDGAEVVAAVRPPAAGGTGTGDDLSNFLASHPLPVASRRGAAPPAAPPLRAWEQQLLPPVAANKAASGAPVGSSAPVAESSRALPMASLAAPSQPAAAAPPSLRVSLPLNGSASMMAASRRPLVSDASLVSPPPSHFAQQAPPAQAPAAANLFAGNPYANPYVSGRVSESSSVSVNLLLCPGCNKGVELPEMAMLQGCEHSVCRECLSRQAELAIVNQQPSSICCRACKRPLAQSELKGFLPKELLNRLEAAELDELLRANPNFVRCPNDSCRTVIEVVSDPAAALRASTEQTNELGIDSKPLTAAALAHRAQHRIRCRVCSVDFCAKCGGSPYHLGLLCEEHAARKTARCCRFCEAVLTAANSRKQAPAKELVGLNDVCTAAECEERRKASCGRVLRCGHFCCGIRRERVCPPCLECGASEPGDALAGTFSSPAAAAAASSSSSTSASTAGTKASALSQTASDFCNICWTESLSAAPCLQLECGHYFHHDCLRQKIRNGYPSTRITFGFLDCPLCKRAIAHPALADILRPHLELQQQVRQKCVERLRLVGGGNAADIASKFRGDATEYAMNRFSFYPCFRCKRPYFGGERQCEGAEQRVAEFDAKELVCGGCIDSAAATCARHGSEFIEYKCKFCCNVAVWFCWGNTHFCDDCHKKAPMMPGIPRSKLPKCTCTIKHPPNGEEYCLGCSVCRFESRT